MRRLNRTLLAVSLSIGPALAAAAQVPLPLDRPGDERPPLPPFERRDDERLLDLPPPPAPPRGSAPVRTVRLHEIRVEGSTILTAGELEALAAPYRDRDVGAEDLVALRDAVTLLYVDRGHVNSGAVIDPQDLSDGTLEIRVVEGRLEATHVEGLSWLRPGYVSSRIGWGAGVPLDVNALEERIRLLREDARIESIHAELLPGSAPGLATLRVRAEEARLWHGALDAGTVQSPSVGGWRIGGALWHDSLLGFGDTLRAGYGWCEGLNDAEGLYSFPVNGLDGRIEAYGRYGDSTVVEDPFDDLQVESLSWTAGVGFAQPVIDRPGARLGLALRGEVRESRTFLLDQPFSFSPGLDEGRARIAVARFVQDLLLRDEVQVFAARSMLSLGLDLFDSTHVFGGFADGRFFSWLAQLQYARRLPWMGIEVVARVDTQLAANPLLPLEQFSIGGFGSVRGYRVNQIVRDDGLVGSIELRIPMLSRADGSPLLQLVPFFDNAYAWNTGQPSPSPRWLGALGVGVRWAATRRILIEAYWGGQLADVPALPDRDLQDRGFGVRAIAFVF